MATSNIQGSQNVMAVSGTETLSGPGGAGGLLNAQKDSKESATSEKFGDVLKQMQAKFGKKEEKQREIKKTLDKDDFLKIMFTQMKFQDPTNPFKPEQMAAEMAQFTSVEQLNNVNQNLTKLAQAHQPAERLAMANLLGKTVTIDRDRFTHTEGSKEAVTFNLPKNAKSVSIALVSAETGETILQKDMGAQKAGEVLFDWDGKKSNTLPAKAGTYMLKVEAVDENEKTIATTSRTAAKVVGLSFEGSEPVFLVGDAKTPTKVSMKNIVRIDDMAGAAGAPNAQASGNSSGFAPVADSASAAANSGASGNFFTFEKGVGSKTLDMSQATPDVKAAINAHLEKKTEFAEADNVKSAPASGAAKNSPQIAKAEPKGFPNGLNSAD